MEWIEFKDGQYPRTGEVIAVKGEKTGIFGELLKVEGTHDFVYFRDDSTHVSFHGLTHWKLIDSPY